MLCHLNETVQPIHLRYYHFMVQKHPLLQSKASFATAKQKQANLSQHILSGQHSPLLQRFAFNAMFCFYEIYFVPFLCSQPRRLSVKTSIWLFIKTSSWHTQDSNQVPFHRWLLDGKCVKFPSPGRNYAAISCSDIKSNWYQWGEHSYPLLKCHNS